MSYMCIVTLSDAFFVAWFSIGLKASDKMRLDKGLSQVELNTLANTRNATPMSYYMLSLWNLFRLALVCACMLFAVLVSMVYSLNRSGTAIKENDMNPSNSPLSLLLNKDQNRAEELQCVFSLFTCFNPFWKLSQVEFRLTGINVHALV